MESLEKLYRRGEAFVREVLFPLEDHYETILVVAHGGLIRTILNPIVGYSVHDFWKLPLENCSTEILEKIKTEEWKKGQLIPSEKEFCEQFQVSRPTVRAAIAYLANQGYLVTVKGKGTFVSKPKIVEDTTVFLESFSKEMATKGISVQTEVLEQRMIAADEEVYNISYFPKKFSFLLKCNFEEESLTGALTRNHVERHHLEKNIDAVLLEGKIARILGVEEKSLGILISAVCQEADRKHVMEYTLSYYPSKRNKFVLKINV